MLSALKHVSNALKKSLATQGFIAALTITSLVLTACSGGVRTLAGARTPEVRVTSTPIDVSIVVASQPAAQATATVAAPQTQTNSTPVTALPTPTATDAITLTPVAPTEHTTQLTPLPIDATTGLTPTEMLTDTAVPEPVEPVQLPAGTVNIALLGVDSRPSKGFANTDVIIIASINPDIPSVTMLSIPRDTLVYVPGWRSSKVNTAFAHGGPDLFRQTIKYNFGIDIDSYAMVNFAAVVHAVDTLDGVDVVATCPLYHVFPKDPYYMSDDTTPMTVTQPYTDTFTGEVWQPGIAVPTQTIDIPYPGVYSLDGLEALAFVRARYGVPGGDVDRGRREQRLVRALLTKARQAGAITKVPQLYSQFQQDIQTDLSLENILYFAGMAGKFSDAVIRSRYLDSSLIRSATLPEVGSVLIFERGPMRDYIQQALMVALNQRPNDGIPIEVWNGTSNPDFGIVAADRLSELGFVISKVQQADQPYNKTTIIDFTTTKKGSALPLLQRTFNIKDEQISAQPTQDGPRYRIIVGPDFNPCYYQEGSYSAVQQQQ
jgi:anionic cell wall polymer biosynthesis LytR-Cps2A-Psr (LCP) family protein